MEDSFIIPLSFRGEELELEAKLHLLGYLHKIEVQVNGIAVLFEPDEERKYRALVSMEQLEKSRNLNSALLQAIAEKLDSLLSLQ